MKVNHPITGEMSAASQQPITGKVSAANEQPGRGEQSERAGKQPVTGEVSAANEQPGRGEQSERAGKQPVTGEVSAANEQPARGSRSERDPITGKVSAANKPLARGPRSGRAVGYSKPPLGRAEQRSSVRIKTLALFERSEFASVPNAASSARNRVSGTDVARLFFGYFLLAKQKKVTRLPGRNPASHRSEVRPSPTNTAKTPVPKNIFHIFHQSEYLTPRSHETQPKRP